MNSNLLNSIIFAEFEKKQLSSSSLIEQFKFIDSNLLKRTLFLIFRYRLNDNKFAMIAKIITGCFKSNKADKKACYKKYRNKPSHIYFHAKRNHYENLIKSNNRNPS